jgi:hypothetical protein
MSVSAVPAAPSFRSGSIGSTASGSSTAESWTHPTGQIWASRPRRHRVGFFAHRTDWWARTASNRRPLVVHQFSGWFVATVSTDCRAIFCVLAHSWHNGVWSSGAPSRLRVGLAFRCKNRTITCGA